MSSQNLENKVFKKADNDDLVFCDFKGCSDRGDYIRCYFDLYKICPKYLTHKNYLKTIQEMKDKGKLRHR